MAAAPSALRTSLRACCAEGAVAELFGACAGGTILTAWALHLGATPFTIGLLGALPLAAQLLQIPAAWLTQAVGPKPVAIAAIGSSRLVWLPMAALPFVDVSRPLALRTFLAVVAVAAVFGVVGSNAWTAWMGELVPAAIRGRFFCRRMIYVTLASTAASLAVAVSLDALVARGWRGPALGALAGVACLAGALSMYLLHRQLDAGRSRERPDWRVLVGILRSPQLRPFLWYLLAWNAAVALSAGFSSLHLLGNLRTGFAIAALHGVGVATVRIISAPLWGQAVDRLGARPVLVLCSFGIAAVPAIWLLPTPAFLWPLAVEAAVSGALWGGHGIALLDLTVHLSPRAARPFYVAVFAATGGVGFAAASVLAGLLASALPDRFELLGETWCSLHVLFLLSAAARVGASVPALRIRETGARPVRDVVRIAVDGAAAALLPRRLTGERLGPLHRPATADLLHHRDLAAAGTAESGHLRAAR